MPRPHPRPFRCNLVDAGDVARLYPLGELDMGTARELARRLDEALAAGSRSLVVDLRGLTFMDSSGLALLIRWSLGAERDGYRFALVAGDERVARLFALTGMDRHFVFVPPG